MKSECLQSERRSPVIHGYNITPTDCRAPGDYVVTVGRAILVFVLAGLLGFRQ